MAATIDPTVLANGFYTLRIDAIDISGRQSSAQLDIEVNSSAKTNAVIVNAIDTTIPLVEFPFSIARQYSSLNQSDLGDFGAGWRLTLAICDCSYN